MLKQTIEESVSSADLDAAVVAAYKEFETPVDQIVADSELGAEFRRLVNSRLNGRKKAEQKEINWRLLTLRKRGEANGGLPRLERAFNGRKNKPR